MYTARVSLHLLLTNSQSPDAYSQACARHNGQLQSNTQQAAVLMIFLLILRNVFNAYMLSI